MSSAAAKPSFDPELSKLVDGIRKVIRSKESVQFGKRVEYFRGPRLVEILKKTKSLQLESDDAAHKYAQRLMDAGFFHRSQRIKTDRRVELRPHPDFKRFVPEGVYTWLYEGSQKKQTVLSFLAVGLVGMACMIKLWPLWLKIVVYYVSLTLLILQTTLFSVRLVLYALFWLVGFKDIWFLPDLLNDDVEFFAAFRPLFGRGTPPIKRDELDRPIEPLPKSLDEEESSGWDFGLVNLLAIVALFVAGMWYVGMFDPELIPEFVVTQHELWDNFPALAPPNVTEVIETVTETVAETVADAAGEATANA